jgi:hypothetical protein
MRSSSALKEQYQLGTLLEEEEDQDQPEESDLVPVVESPVSVEVSIDSPVATRHRPASLSLRPLTLAGGLPTPSLSPSVSSGSRRPALNIHTESPSPVKSEGIRLKRLSSISYKSSSSDSPPITITHGFGLPTPEMTPTSDRRYSATSDISDRPLSTTEQQFLHKSHHALLARIEDLERALTSSRSGSRGRSRPVSFISDTSSRSYGADSSDEMIQLVTDLKAERDELKLQLEADADGWRTRVAGLEKQVGVLAKRIELERREAWVARERAGLLDVEKKALSKELEEQKAVLCDLSVQHESVKQELELAKDSSERLRNELASARDAEDECIRLRAALAEERQKREQYERELEHAGLLATPTPRSFQFPMKTSATGLGLASVDNSAKLAIVVEDDEMTDGEGNGLGHYEDEDSDLDCSSLNSSVSSIRDHFPKTPSPVSTHPRSGHAARASLSRAWTFPKGPRQTTMKREQEIDTFFGCLEDLDSSPPSVYTGFDRDSKSAFSFGSDIDEEDDLPPFVLPMDVGVEVPQLLDIVIEDTDEDTFEGEVLQGGITFTFTAPTAPSTPEPVERTSHVVKASAPESPIAETFEPVAAPSASAPKDARSATPLPSTPTKARTATATPKRAAPSFIPQPKGKTATPVKPTVSRSFVPERKVSPIMFTPPRSPSSGPNSPPDPRTSVFSPQARAPTSTLPLSDSTLEETNDSSRYNDTREASHSTTLLKDTPLSGPTGSTSSSQVPTTLATMTPLGTRFAIPTFTSFTSYLPNLPWNALAGADNTSASSVDLAASPKLATSIPPPGEAAPASHHLASPRQRAPIFVSKARQLEKLRIRMEEERIRQDRIFQGDCHQCTSQLFTV